MISKIGLVLLLCIFPLFMTHGYYNITASKYYFFVCASCCFTLFCFLMQAKRNKTNYSDAEKRTNYSFIAFLSIALIGVLFSDYKIYALTGSQGRHVGLLFYVASYLAYWFISRFRKNDENDYLFLEAAGFLVLLFAVLQKSGFDLFNLTESVPENITGVFLSTLGNANVFVSFFAVCVPISLGLFVFSNNKIVSVLSGSFSFFGFFAFFISNSDSGYLGLLAGFWLLTLFAVVYKVKLERVLLSFSMFFASAIIFGILQRINILKTDISAITEFFAFSHFTYLLFAAFAVLAIIFYKTNPVERINKALRIVFIALSIIAVLAVIIMFVYYNLINTAAPLGTFENYIRFSQSWGSERGHVWKITFDLFKKLPFHQKLFGCGMDTLLPYLKDSFSDQMDMTGFLTDNAHNEFLQYLVTTGILGLFSYLCIIVFTFKIALKSSFSRIALLGIFAYLIQSSVNICQPITTPFLFILIGIANERNS